MENKFQSKQTMNKYKTKYFELKKHMDLNILKLNDTIDDITSKNELISEFNLEIAEKLKQFELNIERNLKVTHF